MQKWETKAVAERDAARETAFKDPMTGAKSKTAYLQHEKEINRAIDEGTAEEFDLFLTERQKMTDLDVFS